MGGTANSSNPVLRRNRHAVCDPLTVRWPAVKFARSLSLNSRNDLPGILEDQLRWEVQSTISGDNL
jgi:hypothetical protein